MNHITLENHIAPTMLLAIVGVFAFGSLVLPTLAHAQFNENAGYTDYSVGSDGSPGYTEFSYPDAGYTNFSYPDAGYSNFAYDDFEDYVYDDGVAYSERSYSSPSYSQPSYSQQPFSFRAPSTSYATSYPSYQAPAPHPPA